jgi:hypothetical protein
MQQSRLSESIISPGPKTRSLAGRLAYYALVAILCWLVFVVSIAAGTCMSSLMFEEQTIEESLPYRFPPKGD